MEKWGKKFVITSHPEYGHFYSAVRVTPAQWEGEYADKPIVTYEEARGILRERGNEVMERGYMDRRLYPSSSEASDSDEEGSSNYYQTGSEEEENDRENDRGEPGGELLVSL